MLYTTLKPDEVFIFGSNSTGFHGAGAAGLACRGDSNNSWRTDAWFLRALRSPIGSPDRIGKWAIVGVSRGFQKGKEGKSYAIQTIESPGKRRSISLEEIFSQLLQLADFAREHPQYKFIMTPIGVGYAGWTSEEMTEIVSRAKEKFPDNIIIPSDLYKSGYNI